MSRYVLTDIEGTTTPITFVHDVLFPYSREHIPEYVRRHKGTPGVRECLDGARATVREEEGRELTDDEAVAQLLKWVAADRKHPALKKLQGLVWRAGYESGAYTAQVYDDVKPCLEAWKKRGLTLGIYSSGSVEAQRLLFKYTAHGDLTPLFSDYFDTAVGGKKEVAAYRSILGKLGLTGKDVVFLSDVADELVAAEEAGMQTVQLVRPGTKGDARFRQARDFHEVDGLLG